MSEERDPKVSGRYRELASEEPPRELDQTILAAAHRAADRPHAPLVTPAGRHRWYFAVGAAAILVLAVGITLHLQRDRPDPEAMSDSRVQEERTASTPASPASPSADAAAPPEQPREAMQARRERPGAPAAQPEAPERWLERILQLRKEGKDDEADKALAEFRRRYPDHKVPEAALRRKR